MIFAWTDTSERSTRREKEVSIETGLPVHNVVRIRSQPGGAGTILNNLAALGVAELFPVGFAGDDGEGFELKRALSSLPGVRDEAFFLTAERQTFTYTKPLVISPGKGPRELNRLDSKNWSPTPASLQRILVQALRKVARRVHAIIVLDQVSVPETGVVTRRLLREVRAIKAKRPGLLVMADSRRSLRGYPPVCLKMNRAELSRLSGNARLVPLREVGPCRGSAGAKINQELLLCHIGGERNRRRESGKATVERLATLSLRGEKSMLSARAIASRRI